MTISYLHTMIRVADLDAAIHFFGLLGLEEATRTDSAAGRFTLVFMVCPADRAAATGPGGVPAVELTYNWPPADGSPAEQYQGGRNFGHIAFGVSDIYAACAALAAAGVTINRPPRDGRMAFVRSPDGISVELLQRGPALPPAEPWASAPNIGTW